MAGDNTIPRHRSDEDPVFGPPPSYEIFAAKWIRRLRRMVYEAYSLESEDIIERFDKIREHLQAFRAEALLNGFLLDVYLQRSSMPDLHLSMTASDIWRLFPRSDPFAASWTVESIAVHKAGAEKTTPESRRLSRWKHISTKKWAEKWCANFKRLTDYADERGEYTEDDYEDFQKYKWGFIANAADMGIEPADFGWNPKDPFPEHIDYDSPDDGGEGAISFVIDFPRQNPFLAAWLADQMIEDKKKELAEADIRGPSRPLLGTRGGRKNVSRCKKATDGRYQLDGHHNLSA